MIGPGVRRLSLEAVVSRTTGRAAMERLELQRLIARVGQPLEGQPQAYRLLCAHRPLAWSVPFAPLDLPETITRVALLAFRGRINALKILLSLGDFPSFPNELARDLSISRSTVFASLKWLEGLPSSTVPWVVQDPCRGGGWFSNLEPDEDDFYDLATYLGTLGQWLNEWDRAEVDTKNYDEFFRKRHGVDRVTGEIIADPDGEWSPPRRLERRRR